MVKIFDFWSCQNENLVTICQNGKTNFQISYMLQSKGPLILLWEVYTPIIDGTGSPCWKQRHLFSKQFNVERSDYFKVTTDQHAFKICWAFYWNYSAKQKSIWKYVAQKFLKSWGRSIVFALNLKREITAETLILYSGQIFMSSVKQELYPERFMLQFGKS